MNHQKLQIVNLLPDAFPVENFIKDFVSLLKQGDVVVTQHPTKSEKISLYWTNQLIFISPA